MLKHLQILRRGPHHADFIDRMNVDDSGEVNLYALEGEAFVHISEARCDGLEDVSVASCGVIKAGRVYEKGLRIWDWKDLDVRSTYSMN